MILSVQNKTDPDLFRVFVSPSGNDTNTGSHGAPLRTIGKARAAVRRINAAMTRDIEVTLRDGVHTLTTAEALTPSDSGQNGFVVMYQARPGERPRISGGQLITGWSDQGGGLWRASTSLTFRQLYVNDVRATRARFPKSGSYGELVFWNTGGEVVEVEAGHADEAADAQELVILGKGVNNSALRIASVSGSEVTPQEPEQTKLFDQTYPPKEVDVKYFFQGGLDLCTAQGEWHLDTAADFVYYRPLGGENMATAVVYAPQVETLVSIVGTDLDTPVHDIEFHGITFEHGTWLYPSTDGYVGDQGPIAFEEVLPADEITSYPGTRLPALVHVDVAADLVFDRCVFRFGGAEGLHFYRAVVDSTISGNVCHDLSGGGIWVDLALLGNTGDSRVPCRRIEITNNYIERCAREFYNTVGIGTAYVDDPVVDHNEVTDMPYVGFSTGWGWSYEANTMSGLLMRRNEVWNCCQLESDSAGIYTLSDHNTGLIEHNYVHGIVRTSVQMAFNISDIYLDEGSGDITVRNNVCTGEADTEVFQNANGSNVTLSNNDASDPGGVIANAGLEAAYEDIRDLVP